VDNYYSMQAVGGIVGSTTQRKQEIGQRLATHLSFIPGPLGADGSVDGAITDGQGVLLAHFQSKLSSNNLDLGEAKDLHSDLIRLKPKVCIYVAGTGYVSSFLRLIASQIDTTVTEVHLITLADVFLQTDKYLQALASIPAHAGGPVDFSAFRV